MQYLKKTDPEIYTLIKKEEERQQSTLMMIPSENIASKAVEEAVGSVLGNKYAEGYPFRRYYQGQEIVDQVETLAVERVKELFNVPYANVQPHSGSPANFAVYHALLKPGETLMGLSLSSGGHLTHGAKFTASSRYFTSVSYEVDAQGYINYEALRKLSLTHKPTIIIAGTTAYPRILDWEAFARIADEVGAYLMADISHISGLVVAGVYPSPVPHAHIITSTTHKTFRGPRGGMIMVTQKGVAKNPDLPKKIDSSIIPGIQGGPHLNTIAGIAVAAKEAMSQEFKTYANRIVENAQTLAQELVKKGIHLVTGGTDSHLLLIDLRKENVLGNTVAEACEEAGIILNRNSVPGDTNPPFYPKGIRLGTPGITSRGMGREEMVAIAGFIADIITLVSKAKKELSVTAEDERIAENRKKILTSVKELKVIREKVRELCNKFPVKPWYA